MATATDTGRMTGVAIAPCTSLNGRIYTRENLAKATQHMQDRLAAGIPITMMVSHYEAWNDASNKVFAAIRVVEQDVPTGAIEYEADFAPTQLGQEMRALYKGDFIAAQSIRGEWLGPVEITYDEDGNFMGETSDDLDILGVDATLNPGVLVAGVRTVESSPSPAMHGAKTFMESVAARTTFADGVAIVELEDEEPAWVTAEADKSPYGDVVYADPGYQKDGKKRYPLDTPKHIRAAWSYINMPKNAGKYSAANLAKVKAKIKAAMKKIGAKTEAAQIGVGDPPAQLLDPDGDGDVDAIQCPSCGEIAPVTDVRLNPDAGNESFASNLPDESTAQGATTMTESATPPATPPAAPAPASSPAPAPTNEASFQIGYGDFAKAITEANLAGWQAGHSAVLGGAAPAPAPANPPAPTTEAAPVPGAAPGQAPAPAAPGTAEGGQAPVDPNAVADPMQERIELGLLKILREHGMLPPRTGLVPGVSTPAAPLAPAPAPAATETAGAPAPTPVTVVRDKSPQQGLREARSARAAEVNEQYPKDSRPARRRIQSGRP